MLPASYKYMPRGGGEEERMRIEPLSINHLCGSIPCIVMLLTSPSSPSTLDSRSPTDRTVIMVGVVVVLAVVLEAVAAAASRMVTSKSRVKALPLK